MVKSGWPKRDWPKSVSSQRDAGWTTAQTLFLKPVSLERSTVSESHRRTLNVDLCPHVYHKTKKLPQDILVGGTANTGCIDATESRFAKHARNDCPESCAGQSPLTIPRALRKRMLNRMFPPIVRSHDRKYHLNVPQIQEFAIWRTLSFLRNPNEPSLRSGKGVHRQPPPSAAMEGHIDEWEHQRHRNRCEPARRR